MQTENKSLPLTPNPWICSAFLLESDVYEPTVQHAQVGSTKVHVYYFLNSVPNLDRNSDPNIDPWVPFCSLTSTMPAVLMFLLTSAALSAHFKVDCTLRRVGSENDYIYYASNSRIYEILNKQMARVAWVAEEIAMHRPLQTTLKYYHIVACQVHPALVKWSCVTRFYVNVSRLVHLSVSSRIISVIVLWYEWERTIKALFTNGLKGSRTVSCRRRGAGFCWRPRLPGTQQYYSEKSTHLCYLVFLWLPAHDNDKLRGGMEQTVCDYLAGNLNLQTLPSALVRSWETCTVE